MKYFLFTNPATRDVFELLMFRHRDWVKRTLDMCQSEAAKSHTDKKADDDMLRDDGQRVSGRLAGKVEEFVDSLVYMRFSGLDELEPLDGIVLEAFSQIDYNAIARAIYYGVEPGDPTAPEIPPIL